MKRKLAVLTMAAVLGLSAVACGSEPAKDTAKTLLCLIDDVDGFLFSQTVFQLLIVQFSLLEDERKFLVFNKVNQRVEACSILLVM